MRVLLVHPRTPPTYAGSQHRLPSAGKAASIPPLGLLGLVFCLVWGLMLWMRHEVIRRQASWPTD